MKDIRKKKEKKFNLIVELLKFISNKKKIKWSCNMDEAIIGIAHPPLSQSHPPSNFFLKNITILIGTNFSNFVKLNYTLPP